jgi:isopentenyldiphosphate isomerase
MRKEYFDEVDEHNEPTGRVISRKDAHRGGLWHRTAHVYFYRQTQGGLEFLVHKRARAKGTSPGQWDTRFGGHIHSGESVKQGAMHEVAEEVGLHLKLSELEAGEIFKRPKPGNNEVNYTFYYEFLGDAARLKLDPKEVEEVKWMSEDEIETEMREHPGQWAGKTEVIGKITEYLKERIL